MCVFMFTVTEMLFYRSIFSIRKLFMCAKLRQSNMLFVQHGFIRILLSEWKNGFVWWSELLQVREELRN